MKGSKFLFFVLSTLIAFASAFTSVKRAARIYYQRVPGAGNTWTLLTKAYDPANCVSTNDTYCVYVVTNNFALPTNPTTAQLIVAGATPGFANKKYIP